MRQRILLDENMPHDLRHALSDLSPVTVRYMGWAGLKNGELLAAAENAGIDVFVTGDKTMQFEQNMLNRKIAVVALTAPHWPIIRDRIEAIVLAINEATPGSLTRVECGGFSRRRQTE